MGFIYEAMDRAKEAIQRAFNNNERKYKDIFAIIDKRWDCQLHHPLHATGYYLNPKFFYTNPNIDNDNEVVDVLYKCTDRFNEDDDFVVEVHKQLLVYKRVGERFGMTVAMKARTEISLAEWWKLYGGKTPHLQTIAIKVLSLTCSSSGFGVPLSIFTQRREVSLNTKSFKTWFMLSITKLF